MTTKLTLSADEQVVRKAHRIAKRNATSVSAMFTRFINSLPEDTAEQQLGPLTRQAAGIAKLPKKTSYRDVLTNVLMDKYDLR